MAVLDECQGIQMVTLCETLLVSESNARMGQMSDVDEWREILGTWPTREYKPHAKGPPCSKWGPKIAGSSSFPREAKNLDM